MFSGTGVCIEIAHLYFLKFLIGPSPRPPLQCWHELDDAGMPRVSVYYAAVCTPDCSIQLCNGGKGEHVGYRTKIHMSDFNADTGMNVLMKVKLVQ